MKHLLPLLFLLTLVFSAYGQSYYVAIVHGQVFYEGQPVQKRDKITPRGEIRFTSEEDYLKLSGPGGLYTLKPGMDSGSNNEFLIALRQEFFPQVRFRPTVAQGMVFSEGGYYFFWPNPRYTYFKKTPLSKIPAEPDLQAIGYVHETEDGLVYRKAYVKDSILTLRHKDFKVGRGKVGSPYIKESAIVHIYDSDAFFAKLDTCQSLDGLAQTFPVYNPMNPIADVALLNEEGNTVIRKAYPALIMDRMGPSRFIKRKEVINDLQFHLEISRAQSRKEFLEDFAYDYYLIEAYGTIYPASLEEVWEELGLD